MNDYEHIMQMVGPTMDAFFGPPENKDGPLPEERDQPDDREEMAHAALNALYALYLDGCAVATVVPEYKVLTEERAATIATELGLSKEWERMVGK